MALRVARLCSAGACTPIHVDNFCLRAQRGMSNVKLYPQDRAHNRQLYNHAPALYSGKLSPARLSVFDVKIHNCIQLALYTNCVIYSCIQSHINYCNVESEIR